MSKIKIEEFNVNWRFTDEDYSKLPKNDLEKIIPFSEKSSAQKWKEFVSKKEGHLMLLNLGNDINATIIENCGWGDQNKELSTKNKLEILLKLKLNQKILFFWDDTSCVETIWGIFLKYWTDFCYPDDDSNVIIIENFDKAIIYIEDQIRIVDRKIEFGEHKTP